MYSTTEGTINPEINVSLLTCFFVGYYAWRDPENGSVFIQSLVMLLDKLADKRDLLTVLTFVNRQVAVSFASYEPENPELNNNKQMCTIVSMLTRLLVFSSKNK